MKRVFDDYGGVVITVIAVVALLGLVVFLMSDTGVMSNAFSKITGQLVDKSEQVIDDVGSLVDRAPTVEELQEKYTFAYYSTLNGAVNDVNAGTIGANADVDKVDAVAGIYTDKKGGVNVVLLKDTTESTTVSSAVDMTINLGGHKLTTTAATGIDLTAGNLVIDGRLEGSGIEKNNTSGAAGVLVKTVAGTELTVKNGFYSVSTNGTSCMAFQLGGKADVSGAVIDVTETTRGGAGLYILSGGEATVYNCTISSNRSGPSGVYHANGVINQGTASISSCNIKAFNTGNEGEARGVYNTGTATIRKCDIQAYSSIYAGQGRLTSGVYNTGASGTLTIEDSYVFGTLAGVLSASPLNVNGGTYEGYGYGGILIDSTGETSYIRNAKLKASLSMPEGYTATGYGNGCGFRFNSGATCNNNKVYMDSCKIYGSGSQIILGYDDESQNNTLYISRSKLYDLDGDYLSVRIDNDTHKLYIGKGCNFTVENTTLPGAVVVTDEVYVQE